MHGPLRRARVHVRQAMHQRMHFIFGHQVSLADEDLVGKADLPARFLPLIKLRGGVLGVHQGEDGVQQVLLGDFLVHEKGLRHRAGVGQTGGLDHHALKIQQTLALFGGQQLQRFAQVFADRAADATIVHLDDVLVGVVHQNLVVDVFFTELVFDHGNFLSVGFGEHALEQSSFAGTQKAGQDGDGNQTHGAPYKTGEELKTKQEPQSLAVAVCSRTGAQGLQLAHQHQAFEVLALRESHRHGMIGRAAQALGDEGVYAGVGACRSHDLVKQVCADAART